MLNRLLKTALVASLLFLVGSDAAFGQKMQLVKSGTVAASAFPGTTTVSLNLQNSELYATSVAAANLLMMEARWDTALSSDDTTTATASTSYPLVVAELMARGGASTFGDSNWASSWTAAEDSFQFSTSAVTTISIRPSRYYTLRIRCANSETSNTGIVSTGVSYRLYAIVEN